MKEIQPVNIWQGGQTKQATVLNSYVISDNLSTTATFYYSLNTQAIEQLSQGNLSMGGADYVAYSSNEDAWAWISAQLGLTIIGDYVPTTLESPTP